MIGKSHSSDVTTFRDSSADPIERAASLSRLASDGRLDLEAEVAVWIEDPDPHLRTAAMRALVGRWRLARHAPAAEALLVDDPDWVVRRNCAVALSMFAGGLDSTEEDRARIVALLFRRLDDERDPAVQEAVYEALLRLFSAPADRYFHENREFDAARDVDWEWLLNHSETSDTFRGMLR
jgi:hypothetical protein